MPGFRLLSMKNGMGMVLLSLAMASALLAQPPPAPVQEEFHRTLPLAANTSIKLDNSFGNVKVTGWERQEVQIAAVKHARDKANLSAATIGIATVGDKLCIATKYAQAQKSWLSWFGMEDNGPCGGQNIKANPDDLAIVDYTIHVPASAHIALNVYHGKLEITGLLADVEAHDADGDIAAQGLQGPLKMGSMNGRIEVSFKKLDGEARIHSMNGEVIVTLAPEIQTRLEAHTMNGSISNDFGLNSTRGPLGLRLNASVGAGGQLLRVETMHGSIEFKKMPSPVSQPQLPKAKSAPKGTSGK